jgi:hypothetical protein
VLLQLLFKFFAQRKGIHNAPGETRDHLAVEKPANLSRGGLEDGMLSHGYLSVSGDSDASVLLHGTDGCAFKRAAHD